MHCRQEMEKVMSMLSKGTFKYPAFYPVTTFGNKFAIDEILQREEILWLEPWWGNNKYRSVGVNVYIF